MKMPESFDKPTIFLLEDRELVRRATSRALKRLAAEVIAPASLEELETLLAKVNEKVRFAMLDVNLDEWRSGLLSAEYIDRTRAAFPNATLALYTGADPDSLSHPKYCGIEVYTKGDADEFDKIRTKLKALMPQA